MPETAEEQRLDLKNKDSTNLWFSEISGQAVMMTADHVLTVHQTSPPILPQLDGNDVIPLGFEKLMTFSSLKMLTSSIPGIVLTPSRFNVLCSLLSSVVVDLCGALCFLPNRNDTTLVITPSSREAGHTDIFSVVILYPERADINTHIRSAA